MPEKIITRFDGSLLERWSYLSTVFRIAARDYSRALNDDAYMDYQLTVIRQTVWEMLELQAELHQHGHSCPPLIAGEGCWPVIASAEWEDVAWLEVVWQAATDWVSQLKEGSLARASLSTEYIRKANDSRTVAVRTLQQVVKDGPVRPVPDTADTPTLCVQKV